MAADKKTKHRPANRRPGCADYQFVIPVLLFRLALPIGSIRVHPRKSAANTSFLAEGYARPLSCCSHGSI